MNAPRAKAWIALALAAAAWSAGCQSKAPKPSETQAKYDQLSSEHDLLTKRYKELETDRDNVLAQTKRLLAEKGRYTEIEEQQLLLREANETILSQKNKLLSLNEKLKRDQSSLQGHFNRLKAAFEALRAKSDAIENEAESLRKSLKQSVEASPQYQKLDREARQLKEDNARQAGRIQSLEKKLEEAGARIAKIETRELKLKKQVLVSEKNLKKLREDQAKLLKTNQDLNRLVEAAPRRFSEMAKQNRDLIRETADMHYNLGVFYTQQRDFTMAAKEYQRALALNPNDPKIHYNIGYLYAELGRHSEAMGHFQRFLELNPDAKEADTIRNYLLVRQTYGDKMAKR